MLFVIILFVLFFKQYKGIKKIESPKTLLFIDCYRSYACVTYLISNNTINYEHAFEDKKNNNNNKKITSQVCKNKENLLNILNSLFSKI